MSVTKLRLSCDWWLAYYESHRLEICLQFGILAIKREGQITDLDNLGKLSLLGNPETEDGRAYAGLIEFFSKQHQDG